MADLPPALAEALRREADGVDMVRLRGLVDELMAGYRAERTEATPLLDAPERAIAYSVYRMPATYAALRRVLGELAERIPDSLGVSFVDLAGGTGAGAWAVTETFGDGARVRVRDRSRHVLELGERLMGDRTEVEWTVGAATEVPPADVAMASYLLGEMDEGARGRVVDAMIEAAPTVVVVEPGTTAGYRRILAARDRLVGAGLTVAAPCPQDGPCPLADGDWCHFAVRFTRPPLLRHLKRAAHGYEDEKFSYVAATRLGAEPAPNRVIRHPQKRQKGIVRLEVCTSSATATPLTIPKRDPDYRPARSIRWGDPWPPAAS